MKNRYVIITIVCVMLIMICLLCSSTSYADIPDTIDVSTLYSQQEDIKNHSHEMADHARALKIPEDNIIIQTASKLWKQANKTEDALAMLATYTVQDEYYLSKTMYAEARGSSEYELSKVAWCILNRVDANGSTIQAVVTAPNQFAYSAYKNGDDYLYLAQDVLLRYCLEKCGVTDSGRTLPKEYMQFRGDGKVNHYYKTFDEARKGINEYTNWLITPYGV
jgi:hypothetical protein